MNDVFKSVKWSKGVDKKDLDMCSIDPSHYIAHHTLVVTHIQNNITFANMWAPCKGNEALLIRQLEDTHTWISGRRSPYVSKNYALLCPRRHVPIVSSLSKYLNVIRNITGGERLDAHSYTILLICSKQQSIHISCISMTARREILILIESSSCVVVRSTGAYKRLSGHPARPVLGWVARVEYPVPKHYTCQAVRSGFRESFSWLSIVGRMRRKIEVPPT